VVPGVSTEDLDKRCYEFIVNEQKAIPANVGYNGLKKQFAQVLIKSYAMEFLQIRKYLKMEIF
jgi:hypothetical protein